MKIGFTGSRLPLEWHQKKKIESVLASLAPEMTLGITGACVGVDAFIARWLSENTEVPQVIVFPSKRDQTDVSLYGLPRLTIVEMPFEGDERQNRAAVYRRRNNKLVELSDRFVAFYRGRLHSGTKMTMNIAERAGILKPSDIHRI